MEFKTQPTNSTPALTAEIAGQVYNLIKQYGDADKAYKLKGDSVIDPEHFEAVDKEIDRIVRELNEYKNGKLISAEVSHIDEETGEKVIDSEAVYYEYTTDEDLANQVSSDYLDVSLIITDIINK
jgi:hypothetical protein